MLMCRERTAQKAFSTKKAKSAFFDLDWLKRHGRCLDRPWQSASDSYTTGARATAKNQQ
jgi:hypothetical protein